ncbi:Homeodomain-like [Parasponia andersonii]|uniref:Homeodomain-like n=1 Tax=Parasponia andersonii TaxID=3476 RepID=A0A2P5AVM8_PARAD|nr:Homeodomain-like [Parasponia andersonii]
MAKGAFAIAQPLRIRTDYSATDLWRLARQSRDADWSRRLLALSIIYDGSSCSQVASFDVVGLQIVCDWVKRFNSHGSKGLKTGKATGRQPLLNDDQQRALA